MNQPLHYRSGPRHPPRPVAARLHRPATLWARTLGLLARPPLTPDEALWLEPCGGIHTWGLRQTIDVAFLAADLTVLRVVGRVRPWSLVLAPRGTRSVLEFAAGRCPLKDGMSLLRSGAQ